MENEKLDLMPFEFPSVQYEVEMLSSMLPFMALHFLSFCDDDNSSTTLEERQALFLFNARLALKEGMPQTVVKLNKNGKWDLFDESAGNKHGNNRQILSLMPLGHDFLEELIQLEADNLELWKLNISEKHAFKSQVRASKREIDFLKERDQRALEVHLELCRITGDQEEQIRLLKKQIDTLEEENSELTKMINELNAPTL